jgi:hypothetical protein
VCNIELGFQAHGCMPPHVSYGMKSVHIDKTGESLLSKKSLLKPIVLTTPSLAKRNEEE